MKKVLVFARTKEEMVGCLMHACRKLKEGEGIVATTDKDEVVSYTKSEISRAYVFANPDFSKEMLECLDIHTKLARLGIKSNMVQDAAFGTGC